MCWDEVNYYQIRTKYKQMPTKLFYITQTFRVASKERKYLFVALNQGEFVFCIFRSKRGDFNWEDVAEICRMPGFNGNSKNVTRNLASVLTLFPFQNLDHNE